MNLFGNEFSKDCKDVGNYLHDNAHQVHNALYVKYNGIGELKTEVFEDDFYSFSPYYNSDVGWGRENRLNYFKANYVQAHATLKANKELNEKVFLKNLRRTSFKKFNLESSFLVSLFGKKFCKGLVGSSLSKKCRDGVRESFKIMNIQQLRPWEKGPVTSMSLPQVIGKTFVSHDQLEVIYQTISELLPRTLTGNYEHHLNLVELLEKYVSKNTELDNKQKDYLKWNIIGAYATRGASFGGYFKNLATENTSYTASAHYELFNLAHAFDSKKETGESLFSLPRFKKNSCVFGKAYHFWMAAYLSHSIFNKTKNKGHSFISAAASGVLYDFFGNGTSQRGRLRIYEEDLNSIYTKSIQQSILFKILGALYGVAPEVFNKLDVDRLYSFIRANMSKGHNKIYKSQLKHIKNLAQFLDITLADEILKLLPLNLKD